jgi:thiosulfate/3-mercaptopyruvate sulfurtransferase
MPLSPLIDAHTLAPLLGSPAIALLDCRFDLAAPEAGRRAYLAGHIPGAHYADLERDLSAPISASSGRHPLPDREQVAAWLRRLGILPGVRVIAYDQANAAIAARAWWLLRWVGHREVSILDGGFNAWVAAGGALEAGERPMGPAQPAPTEAPGPPACEAVIDAPALMRALAAPRALLVDARAPERFSGAVEPIDPVAGHVPGAVNHPFQSNLAADGRFLPVDELARRWRERLDGRSPADLIMMCGSGVTACQNLLAMDIAGLPGARLYAGSWSEWIRDPHRPVARGA